MVKSRIALVAELRPALGFLQPAHCADGATTWGPPISAATPGSAKYGYIEAIGKDDSDVRRSDEGMGVCRVCLSSWRFHKLFESFCISFDGCQSEAEAACLIVAAV